MNKISIQDFQEVFGNNEFNKKLVTLIYEHFKTDKTMSIPEFCNLFYKAQKMSGNHLATEPIHDFIQRMINIYGKRRVVRAFEKVTKGEQA